MNERIRTLLQLIYPAQAAQVEIEFAALIKKWEPQFASAEAVVQAFAPGDALLITYADQVTEPGAAPLRSLNRFASKWLKDVVSAVHLLPFYPWSSDDGFSVKDYYQVEPVYGTWEDIAELRRDFELMFDAVFNHMSEQSAWFQAYLRDASEFRDYFVEVTGNPCLDAVVRPRALPLLTEFVSAAGRRKIWTTFSADQVDLNVANPKVLLALTDVLLFYARRGARYIRLDAIGFLWKEIGTSCIHLPQTHAIIQLFRAVVDYLRLPVRLVTETNVPHRDNVSYFGNGANEAHVVYNFALPPLVLHSFVTGDTTAISRWAEELRTPSSGTAFLNFLASHDGIGLNPVRGILEEGEITRLVDCARAHQGLVSFKSMPDGSQLPYELNINYLDALSDPAGGDSDDVAARKLLTAHAIMLSLPGVPALYFHSLVGSRGDPEGARTTGIARRINRAKLTRAALEAELSRPGSLRARVLAGFKRLLTTRRTGAAFAPAAPCAVLPTDPRVFAVIRGGEPGQRFCCVHNVSSARVEIPAGRLPSGPVTLEAFSHRWLAC